MGYTKIAIHLFNIGDPWDTVSKPITAIFKLIFELNDIVGVKLLQSENDSILKKVAVLLPLYSPPFSIKPIIPYYAIVSFLMHNMGSKNIFPSTPPFPK